eukprot:RCo019218
MSAAVPGSREHVASPMDPGRRPGGPGEVQVLNSNRFRYPSTPIDYGPMHFLIIDAPVDSVLPQYITELKNHNALHLVRTCEPTYDAARLAEFGIQHHEMSFSDGDAPSKKLVAEWLQLVDHVFGPFLKKSRRKSSSTRTCPESAGCPDTASPVSAASPMSGGRS